jgi:hypothetical protein
MLCSLRTDEKNVLITMTKRECKKNPHIWRSDNQERLCIKDFETGFGTIFIYFEDHTVPRVDYNCKF